MFGRKAKRIKELEQREWELLREIDHLNQELFSQDIVVRELERALDDAEQTKPKLRSNFRQLAN